MSKLEKYIREQAPSLDTAQLPEGAEDRFLQRWEASEKSRKRRIFLYTFSAIAAVVLVLAVLPWKSDSFRGVENNPDAIYARYLAIVSDAWEVAAADEDAMYMLSSLTEEPVPLQDQLPEELSPEEQAVILRAHYGSLLEGVDKVLKTIKR